MRKAIAALVVAALAFGGWWIYAGYVMRDRASQLAASVRTEILDATRDGDALPDQDEVRERIEARARQVGAEVVDLEISQEQIDRAPEPASNQLQMVLERLQKNRVRMSPTPMQTVTLTPRAAVATSKYAVHGEIVVSYGLWSHRERLDVERVLRRRVVR